MSRETHILSAVMRQAWDTGDLRVMNKNSPVRATGAHISVLGHTTGQELLLHLTGAEQANGFGNRHLWLSVKRSKLLSRGGSLKEEDLEPIINRLNEALEFARKVKELKWSNRAREFWDQLYPKLTADKPGLLGAMTARAEAQVVRLAAHYALENLSDLIKEVHLRAALALWDYSEASIRYIFGERLGDPLADELQGALRERSEGMTKTQIRDLFTRNKSAEQRNSTLWSCMSFRQQS
jgi:DNA replicative helicase MCM subunit Mcm2 (Cdc46/Mcm family)